MNCSIYFTLRICAWVHFYNSQNATIWPIFFTTICVHICFLSQNKNLFTYDQNMTVKNKTIQKLREQIGNAYKIPFDSSACLNKSYISKFKK